jgi:hypothetical protein
VQARREWYGVAGAAEPDAWPTATCATNSHRCPGEPAGAIVRPWRVAVSPRSRSVGARAMSTLAINATAPAKTRTSPLIATYWPRGRSLGASLTSSRRTATAHGIEHGELMAERQDLKVQRRA